MAKRTMQEATFLILTARGARGQAGSGVISGWGTAAEGRGGGGAGEGQGRPELDECLDLVRGGLWMRLRPRVPRSDRSVLDALRLMCLGAGLELLAAITLLATVDDVRSAVARANPGLTDDRWH